MNSRIRLAISGLSFLVFLLLSNPGGEGHAAPPANPILQKLAETGVVFDGVHVRLPHPQMQAVTDSDKQRAIVETAAKRYGWKRFVRPSPVAPMALKLRSVKDGGGKRIGMHGHLQFVAYGQLTTLLNEEGLQELFAPANAKKKPGEEVREIRAETLRQLDIPQIQSPDCEERFVQVAYPMLRRVQIRGLGRAVQVRTPSSVITAWELDTRFSGHAELRSQWQSITKNRLGKTVLGTPQPYSGHGGYVHATALREPKGALFIECHVAFHEPHGWFRGGNALRSKLPLLIRESVEKFRRELARVEKKKQKSVNADG